MLESLTEWLGRVSDFVWGPYCLIPLLLGAGLFLTVRLRGLQFRQLGPALHLAFVASEERKGPGEISHFQALMTALAATVGTGNIVGVATAIAAGAAAAASVASEAQLRRPRRPVLDVDDRSGRHGLEVLRSAAGGEISGH